MNDKKTFVEEFGFEPMTPDALAYYKGIPGSGLFLPWESRNPNRVTVKSIAAARGHSLTLEEVRELVDIDEKAPEGAKCQFPDCNRQPRALKGVVVDRTTGQPMPDRLHEGQPLRHGMFVVRFEKKDESSRAVPVSVFACLGDHLWTIRQGDGEVYPAMTYEAAEDKCKAILNRGQQRESARAELDNRFGRSRRQGRVGPKGSEVPGERRGRSYDRPRW